MPSHYKFCLWDTAVPGLLLSLTDTSCSLRLLTPLPASRHFHLAFPRRAKTRLSLCFSPCPSSASAARIVCHPCAPRAGGCRRSLILLRHTQLSLGEILEVASYKADDGVQSSAGCLTNTSRISGLPLTALIYEGEQHSSLTCPISEALLF